MVNIHIIAENYFPAVKTLQSIFGRRVWLKGLLINENTEINETLIYMMNETLKHMMNETLMYDE